MMDRIKTYSWKERNDIDGGGYLVWCFYVTINS
jgi:hypothetical protein